MTDLSPEAGAALADALKRFKKFWTAVGDTPVEDRHVDALVGSLGRLAGHLPALRAVLAPEDSQ